MNFKIEKEKKLRWNWRGNNSGSSEDNTHNSKCKIPDIQLSNVQEIHNESPGWRMAEMWEPLFF